MPAVAGLTGFAFGGRGRGGAPPFFPGPRRPPRSVGLYHFALLLPDRAALAAILRRLLESGWPLDGAGDHGVSEALYLRDPEGNGIELARGRPREEWPRAREGV